MSARDSLPTRHWLLAAALLAVEYIVALLVFDSERMPISEETKAFALLGESMSAIIVVATAMLLVGGRLSPEETSEISQAFREPRRVWPSLVGHLLTYTVALSITVFIFNPGFELQRPWLWVAVWAASAVGSFLLLLASVVPVAALKPLRRPVARALAVGVVVGGLAFLAGRATSVIWRPMSVLTLDVVAWLLDLTGHEVVYVREELLVGTLDYAVIVDRPCSGYEGIGLITVMLSFYLYTYRESLRFPNALLLLPVGAILIWISNSMRIAALVWVGTWVSPEIAEGGFHSAAGWLLFCGITLGLVAVSRQSGWFSRDPAKYAEGSFRTPEGAFLLPLLFLIAAALVTQLFTSDFDYLYPARILAPLIPLWVFRSYYRELRWSWSWMPLALGTLVFIVWVAVEPAPTPEATSSIPNALAAMSPVAAFVWLAARALGSSFVVPVAEELAFRGYLLRRLISADFTKVSPKQFTLLSFLGSSIVFGALHGRWLPGIFAGMVYAGAQYSRGKVSDAIVAHAVTNALLAGYVLLTGAWQFW